MSRIKKLYAVILTIMMVMTTSVMAFATETDSNTNLSTMTITQKLSTGETKDVVITPAFSPDVTNYTAELDADCIEVVFNVTTESANASAEAYWTNIDKGANTSGVKVTASDGSQKEYVLSSNVPDTNPETVESDTTSEDEEQGVIATVGDLKAEVDGKELPVISIADGMTIPAGFVTEAYEFNGNNITVLKSNDEKVIMMYLEESGKQRLFSYDESSQTFSRAVSIKSGENTYTIVKYSEEGKLPTGYEETNIKVNKVDVSAWTLGNGSTFYLVAAVNESGDIGMYSLNVEDNSIQKFNDIDYGTNSGVDSTNMNNLQKKYDDLKNSTSKISGTRLKIIIGMGIGLLVLLFLLLHMVLKIKEYNALMFEDDYDEDEDVEIADEEDEVYEEDEIDKKALKKAKKAEAKAEKKAAKKAEKQSKYDDLYEDEDSTDEEIPDEKELTPREKARLERMAKRQQSEEMHEVEQNNSEQNNAETDDDDMISFIENNTLSLSDISSEVNKIVPDEFINEITFDEPDISATASNEKNVNSEQAIKELDESESIVEETPEEVVTPKQAATLEQEEAPKQEDTEFESFDIDFSESIIGELTEKSDKIDEAASKHNADFTVEDEGFTDYSVDLSGLTDDDDDEDFEFFDFDDKK